MLTDLQNTPNPLCFVESISDFYTHFTRTQSNCLTTQFVARLSLQPQLSTESDMALKIAAAPIIIIIMSVWFDRCHTLRDTITDRNGNSF